MVLPIMADASSVGHVADAASIGIDRKSKPIDPNTRDCVLNFFL